MLAEKANQRNRWLNSVVAIDSLHQQWIEFNRLDSSLFVGVANKKCIFKYDTEIKFLNQPLPFYNLRNLYQATNEPCYLIMIASSCSFSLQD